MRNDMRLGGWHETVSVDEVLCGALCQFRGTLSSGNLTGNELISVHLKNDLNPVRPHWAIRQAAPEFSLAPAYAAHSRFHGSSG